MCRQNGNSEETAVFDIKVYSKKKFQTWDCRVVKIDRVLYDWASKTPIGISGTFRVKCVKFRASWDLLCNLQDARRIGIAFRRVNPLYKLLKDRPESFRLVVFKKVSKYE